MKVTRLVGLCRRRNHLGTFYRVSPFSLVCRSFPLRRRSDLQPLYRRAGPAFRLDSVVNLGFLGSACAGLPWRLAVPPLAGVRCPYRLASPFSFARLVPSVGMIDYSKLLKYYFSGDFGRIFRNCSNSRALEHHGLVEHIHLAGPAGCPGCLLLRWSCRLSLLS